MEQKIATSVEQSKKLIELGLNPDTADMYYKYVLPNSDKIMHTPEIGSPIHALEWYNNGYTTSGKTALTMKEFCIPCWSLSALIELMPQHIDTRLGWQKFGIDKGCDGGIYQVFYENKNSYIQMKEKTAIDAVIEMIVYLFEKGYLKK